MSLNLSSFGENMEWFTFDPLQNKMLSSVFFPMREIEGSLSYIYDTTTQNEKVTCEVYVDVIPDMLKKFC